MSGRDFDEGISYLKEKIESSWGLVIESACRENLYQFQPRRSKFKAYAKPHIYGPCEILICEGNFRQLVFETMLKDGRCTAPTLNHTPIYTGQVDTLRPFQDKIVRLVDDVEFVVYNVTLPQHILFPGFVKLAVYENNSTTFVSVSGQGIGNWASFNTFLGPLLFKRILNRFLVPSVQEGLNSALVAR